MAPTLLSLGHGYSAQALAHRLLADGWTIYGTTRNPDRFATLQNTGVTPLAWDREPVLDALDRSAYVLTSVAPGSDGDPALHLLGDALARAAPRLTWVGYLSTTAVYGDHQGGWVTEDTPLKAATKRGAARIAAEAAWRAVPDLPLHIFRLAGIYGRGRGPFAKVRAGTARRVLKEGQVFSRIHVHDIATVLAASIAQPDPGQAYNVCDDEPAPPQDVIAYAAQLLGLPLPPEVDFDTADLSPMARSFYAENKRVSNARLRNDLGVTLAYPNYRVGLKALLAEDPT